MNTRTFVITIFVLLAFVVNASSTYAATCPVGTPADVNGNYYLPDNSTLCSPQSGVDTSQTVRSGVDTTGSGSNVTLINPLQGGTSLESFLNNILAFVIRIGTIVVILMLVYVGYLFVVARGEPAKITEARSALLWTVVGALILLGAQAIAIGITATVKALSVGG